MHNLTVHSAALFVCSEQCEQFHKNHEFRNTGSHNNYLAPNNFSYSNSRVCSAHIPGRKVQRRLYSLFTIPLGRMRACWAVAREGALGRGVFAVWVVFSPLSDLARFFGYPDCTECSKWTETRNSELYDTHSHPHNAIGTSRQPPAAQPAVQS